MAAGKIYTIPFGSDFIAQVERFIEKDGKDLSRVAIVFAGKRPAFYLQKRFAELRETPFYGPGTFSMDEFMDYSARKTLPDFSDLEYSDALWLLYETVGSTDAFRGHPIREKGFGEFFYWGCHILDFINQLDTEHVDAMRLRSLERNAEIGYDVPPEVNRLLTHIGELREAFHHRLVEEKYFTRGYKYLVAGTHADATCFNEFEKVYFPGLFGLVKTEQEVIRALWAGGAAEIIFEGNANDWPIIDALCTTFDAEVEVIAADIRAPETVRVHSGFDTHSEVLKVHEILCGSKEEKTAIILPRPEPLFPLLSFVIDRVETRYNISIGYPLGRTPVYDLIAGILEAQTCRRMGGLYRTMEYLNVILHPFVKNLTFAPEVRRLLLTVEKMLTGGLRESVLEGKPFIALKEIEDAISEETNEGSRALEEIHGIFFKAFEDIVTLSGLCENMEKVLDFVLANTPVRSYILSGEIFKRTFELLETMKDTKFSKIRFHDDLADNRRVMGDLLLQHLRSAAVPFETRPIEPLEVLGMLESRNINFDRVIILDMNEGVLPQGKDIDPLIPLGVYSLLGIPSPEYNEEIYRYQVYRLVRSAREVHLLYIDSPEKPRSRYIEQFLWEKERETGRLNVIPIERSLFTINLKPGEKLPAIRKTDAVLHMLRTRTYSPSQLDNYIRCPVIFYWKYVLSLEQKTALTRDIDPTERGTIIHRILYETFYPFQGKEIKKSLLEAFLFRLHEVVNETFRNRITTGEYYLFRELAAFKLQSFLRKDVGEREGVFEVRHLEHRLGGVLDVEGSPIKLKGIIDRVDFEKEKECFTIIDYKTGGAKQYRQNLLTRADPRSIEDIHTSVETLQLPVYVHLFQEEMKQTSAAVNAKLILLKNNEEESLFGTRGDEEREKMQDACMTMAKTVLTHLLDPSLPFQPFNDVACKECEFRALCHV